MNEIEGKMTHLPLLEAFHLEGGYTKAEAMEIMENVFLHNPYYALLLPPLSESDSRIDDILIELFINAYLLSNGNMRLLQEAILTELSAEFSGDKTIVKEMLKGIANEDRDEFADRARWERFDSANLALPYRVALERYLGRKEFESVEPEIESPYSAYIIYESDGETLVGHAKNTVKDAASDVNSGIKTFGGAVVNKAREIKTSIQKSDNPIIRQFIKWYEWAVNYDNEEDKREAVITGSYFIRLRRIFGKFLLYYSLRPAIIAALPAGTFLKFLIGIVTFLGGAIDLGVNEIGRPLFTSGDPNYEKARNRVIQELELELKMTREKIEDARSAGNVKAKYELMRVENKIESEIMRIKYGSKR